MTHTPSPRIALRLRLLGLWLAASALALPALPAQAGSVADMFRDLWERARATGQVLPRLDFIRKKKERKNKKINKLRKQGGQVSH